VRDVTTILQGPAPPGMALRQAALGDVPMVYDQANGKRPPQLQARDLEIMSALWRYDLLTTNQIGFVWWEGRHPSRAQIRLAELSNAGLLARFRPLIRRGRHQWIYQLARDGFRAAQQRVGVDGAYVDPAARWSDQWAVDMRRVQHQLRVNGWILAYRHMLGSAAVDWLGRREARMQPEEEAEGVAPDAAILIELEPRSAPLELLVELARDERPMRLAQRLQRYGELLAGGWRSLPRHRRPEQQPAAVFVGAGYREVEQLIRAADAALRASGPGVRDRLLFCAEPDLHAGSARAWMLPPAGEPTAREVRLPGAR
jgi:protein involved in plasmid replication-relaxation